MDNNAVIQYIGARYVTKIYENSQDAGSAEWEANVNYEPLTLVTEDNSTYLSRKVVPKSIGKPSENGRYWALTGAYNGQIASLQNQIDDMVDGSVDGSLQNQINMITSGFVTPEMFGAVGDGITDDTEALQDAINSGSIVVFGEAKIYGISEPLIIPSDTTIDLNKSTIKVLGDMPIFMLKVWNAENVIIKNGKLYGVSLAGYENTRWCVDIIFSRNVTVDNVEITNNISDAIVIGSFWETPPSTDYSIDNVVIKNCYIHDIGRNGITLSNGAHVTIENNRFETIKNNAPKACIDIEPESIAGYTFNLNTIIIRNNHFYDSVYGITLSHTGRLSTTVDVVCENNIFEKCSFKHELSGSAVFTAGYNIWLTNNIFIDSFDYGVLLKDRRKTQKTVIKGNVFTNITGRNNTDTFAFICINLHTALSLDQGGIEIVDNDFPTQDWISGLSYIKVFNEIDESLYDTAILGNTFKSVANRRTFVCSAPDLIDASCHIFIDRTIKTNYAGVTMTENKLLLADSTGGANVKLECESPNTMHEIVVTNYTQSTLTLQPVGSKKFKGNTNRATVDIDTNALIQYIVIGDEIIIYTDCTVTYTSA